MNDINPPRSRDFYDRGPEPIINPYRGPEHMMTWNVRPPESFVRIDQSYTDSVQVWGGSGTHLEDVQVKPEVFMEKPKPRARAFAATNVTGKSLFRCEDCGALIEGSTTKHDKAHQDRDAEIAMLKKANLDLLRMVRQLGEIVESVGQIANIANKRLDDDLVTSDPGDENFDDESEPERRYCDRAIGLEGLTKCEKPLIKRVATAGFSYWGHEYEPLDSFHEPLAGELSP